MDRYLKRFWTKVDKNGPVPPTRPDLGPCWLWTAGTTEGYGRFWIGKRCIGAHLYAFMAERGPRPPGLDADHLCRVRICVNPDHLEFVTPVENIKRGTVGECTRARQLAKTHCPHGHPYAGDNLITTKAGRRQCRACHRVRDRAFYQRKAQERQING